MYVCLSVCLPACLPAWMYVCMYIYMCTFVYYMYIVYIVLYVCIICLYYMYTRVYIYISYIYIYNSVCCDLSNRITSRLPVPSLLHRALLEQAQASKGLAPQTVGPNGFLQENTPEVYQVYPVWWYFTQQKWWINENHGIWEYPIFRQTWTHLPQKLGALHLLITVHGWPGCVPCSSFKIVICQESCRKKWTASLFLKSPNSQNRLLSSTFIVNLENCVTA